MFHYTDTKLSRLMCEGISLAQLSKKIPTPFFVYSKSSILNQCKRISSSAEQVAGINVSICYAVKALSNINILSLIKNAGLGADVVSEGELLRCIEVGFDPKKIVFSGVGKSISELKLALSLGLRSIHVESLFELKQILKLADEVDQKNISVGIRINPDILSPTHHKIATGSKDAKFGVQSEDLETIIAFFKNQRRLNLAGISCHIGSQIFELQTFIRSAQKMRQFCEQVGSQLPSLQYVDLGGGFGISYENDFEPFGFPIETYFSQVAEVFKGINNIELLVEPGRWLVAKSGVLVSKIIGVKQQAGKTFVVLDAGMSELMRPALYQAKHRILPLINYDTDPKSPLKHQKYDVVGPICESSDVFLVDQEFASENIVEGAHVAIMDAGAYGSSMSSNYNTRPHVPEVLIEDKFYEVIRKPQQHFDIWHNERL